MKQRFCVARKHFIFFLIFLCVILSFLAFSYILNRNTPILNTRASSQKLINPSPQPIQPNEFRYYAILNDNLDYYLPNQDNNYKYMLNGHTLCGGALVGDDWIVTSAHCFKDKDIGNLRIALNISQLQGSMRDAFEASQYFYKVEMVIPHPLYNSVTLDNDIALVQLDRDVPSFIPRVKIPTDASAYDISKQLTIVGVGCTDINPTPGITAPYPSGTYSKQYSLDVQKGYFNYKIENNNTNNPEIVLTNPDGVRKSVCHGDSGSPMIKGGGDDTLLGVVSSFDPGYFAIPGHGALTYTRNTWLRDTMLLYDKLGINCFFNTSQNYKYLILQKLSLSSKKLVISTSSKEDMYVVANLIRELQTQISTLSDKEISIYYSCNTPSPTQYREILVLQNVGECSPVHRVERCTKLKQDIEFTIYKDGRLYDDVSNFTSQYHADGIFAR